jgi:hypothetical protein
MLLCVSTLGFLSCQSEEKGPNLIKTNYTLYSDATTQIEGSGLSDVVWDSDNEFVATAEDDELTSFLVGSATIKSGGSTMLVTVKPRYTLYTEPYMLWGYTKSQIIAKCGTPKSETDDALLYETGNSYVPYALYLFENSRLTSCGVVAQVSVASNLVDFLGERYIFLSLEGTTATFAHCYGKVSDPNVDYGGQLGYSSSIGGFAVVYVPSSSNKNSSTLELNLDETRGCVENIPAFTAVEKAFLESGVSIAK